MTTSGSPGRAASANCSIACESSTSTRLRKRFCPALSTAPHATCRALRAHPAVRHQSRCARRGDAASVQGRPSGWLGRRVTRVDAEVRRRERDVDTAGSNGGTAEAVLADLGDDGVLTLTFNRPERRNGWSEEIATAYFGRLAEAEADPAVRTVVVTGAGKT